jgi:tRNA-2-methylthio-N6-dimethylallyladenosine synthase
MMKQFFTEIYGCQMNVSDTLELEEALKKNEWGKTEDPTLADAVIINTCAVRQTAQDRVLRRLGYYKHLKSKKDFTLIFMGCVAQKEKESLIHNFPFIDYVVGPKNRHLIPKLLKDPQNNQKRKNIDKRVLTSLDGDEKDAYLDPVKDAKLSTRAFITIINGCSKFCTYCIVPFTRGMEKSIASETIIAKAKELVADGVKEIYLLGQNVNSYGLDTNDISFAKLLKAIGQIQGVERIKFISSHPRDISDELIEEMANNPKISRNFHFAMQSGSDEILRRMNRQHTYEHFKSLILKLREKIPDITLSTDIIVGFPTESQKDFEDTLNALKELQFANCFVYMYSQREGTAAALFEDDITLLEKKRRAQILMALQEQLHKEFLESFIGKVVNVIVEKEGKNPSQYVGFNEYDVRTVLNSQEPLIGKSVKAKVIKVKGRTLEAEIL